MYLPSISWMLRDRAKPPGTLSDQNVVVAITALMMLVIFLAEITTPWELTVPMLYAVPLLISLWFLSPRLLYAVWGAALVLTAIGIIASPELQSPFSLANRAMTIALICAIGFLGVRRKKLEMRLRDVTDELTASNATLRGLEKDANWERTRAEFYVDLLTHDINNYNAAALGYLQLAGDDAGKMEASVPKAMGALEDSTELIGTVKQLHLAGDRARRGGEVDLNELLLDLIKDMEAPPGRPVEVEYEPVPGKIVNAPRLLRDAVQNILWNAVVHTGGPVHIWIELTTVAGEGERHHLISIIDDGPGVPDELKEKIFQRRTRGGTSGKGSGLGLYLVKVIAEELGGRVWVEDRVPGDHSQGAKFQILIPAAAGQSR